MYANKSVADAPLQGKVDGARMASRGGCPLSAISLERLLAVTVRREIDALTLEELDCVLASDAHHHRTPSRNYGEMDPLSTVGVQMVRCSARCDPVLGTVMEVGVTPDKVLSALEAGKYVEIDGWGLSDQIGQGVFWLTTPYGIDCMWYELTLAGCKKCLKRIEEHVDEGREF